MKDFIIRSLLHSLAKHLVYSIIIQLHFVEFYVQNEYKYHAIFVLQRTG